MAGDWIKVEKATPAKTEVLAISEMLGIHPAHAFGLCVKFWMWCDDQLTDGNAKNVTRKTLDYVIGHDGMTDALLKVDWLRDRSGSLEVPRFDRHLSEGAKNRALTKERVRKSKAKSNDPPVKKVTQTPLLEKRREEKIEREKSTPARPPDSIEDAFNAFLDSHPREAANDLQALADRINGLSPIWKKHPHLTGMEMQDLAHPMTAKAFMALEDRDWNLLRDYLRYPIPEEWAADKFWQPNQRSQFIRAIGDIIQKAEIWAMKAKWNHAA